MHLVITEKANNNNLNAIKCARPPSLGDLAPDRDLVGGNTHFISAKGPAVSSRNTRRDLLVSCPCSEFVTWINFEMQLVFESCFIVCFLLWRLHFLFKTAWIKPVPNFIDKLWTYTSHFPLAYRWVAGSARAEEVNEIIWWKKKRKPVQWAIIISYATGLCSRYLTMSRKEWSTDLRMVNSFPS